MVKLYEKTREAVFLSRPNRFVARVLLQGEEIICHVKNTGRCRELLLPGAKVILAESANPKRKTGHDLVAVYKGDMLVNLDSQAPNRVAGAWLRACYPQARVRPEVSLEKSRLDFLVEGAQGKLYVEVKGVTLEENGLALFPDAPTLRGRRHVEELTSLHRQGHEALVLFILQMSPMKAFSPHTGMDPAFSRALHEAVKAGVRVLALEYLVTPDGMALKGEVPVVLP